MVLGLSALLISILILPAFSAKLFASEKTGVQRYSNRPDEIQLLMDTAWQFTIHGTYSIFFGQYWNPWPVVSFGHTLRIMDDGSYGLDSYYTDPSGNSYPGVVVYGDIPAESGGGVGYHSIIEGKSETHHYYTKISGGTASGVGRFQRNEKFTTPYEFTGVIISGTAPTIDPAELGPSAPVLSWSHMDYNVTVSWTAVPGASGYLFSFEPATPGVPFDGQFEYSLDFDTRTEFGIILWSGACYYISIQAYTNDEYSDFSNLDAVCFP